MVKVPFESLLNEFAVIFEMFYRENRLAAYKCSDLGLLSLIYSLLTQ